ncbi:uncharacterized protein JCM6883_007655 [Sporobolomyces salmoneus]|uniref:uncharacterized protein n=1 Tax=Sporobolomyces salmoneus TaxID=183962 RepID=UPI003174229E
MPQERKVGGHPGPFANKPLSKITPEDAAVLFAQYLEEYKSSDSCPADRDIKWPSEMKYRKLPRLYSEGMLVNLALDIGGPACPILQVPSQVSPKLLIYARKKPERARGATQLEAKWRKAHEERGVPYVAGLSTASEVVLPRPLLLSSPPAQVGKKLPIFKLGKFIKGHPIWDRANKVVQTWTFLKLEFDGGQILPLREIESAAEANEDDQVLTSAQVLSSTDIVHLLSELEPYSDRNHTESASILFRVRIARHKGAWVPWEPILSPNELIPIETRKPDSHVVTRFGGFYDQNGQYARRAGWSDDHHRASRSSPPVDARQQTAHALSHRQQGIYGQLHARGGRRNF